MGRVPLPPMRPDPLAAVLMADPKPIVHADDCRLRAFTILTEHNAICTCGMADPKPIVKRGSYGHDQEVLDAIEVLRSRGIDTPERFDALMAAYKIRASRDSGGAT